MTIHNQPWLFGDEYLYLNKARNLKFGIDVITDATQGHKYPPLYSYLLSLAIGNDPVSSYRRVQFLNIFSSQILLLISFFLLNKVYGFSKRRYGKLFIILAYFATALLSNISGYYLVAMSENLFLPITLLVFSLLSYIINFKKNADFKWLTLLGFLTAASILTRTIAIVLVPAIIVALINANQQKKQSKKQQKLKIISTIKTALIFCALSILPVLMFEFIEKQLVQNSLQAAITKDYSSFMPSYSKNFINLITLKSNYFATAKILGNHLIYIVFSSFFFPAYFFINELVNSLKTKKFSSTWIFVLIYGVLTVGVSFLHSYGGFLNNPIRYSTYFRYLDSLVVITFAYGLIRLWQFINHKIQINKVAIYLFIVFGTALVILLPQRDFYLTINSLGWGWLDLLLPLSLLIRIILILIIYLTVYLISKKTVLLILPAIIAINVLTFPVSVKMHNWLADDSQGQLQQPVIVFAKSHQDKKYYFNSQLLKSGEAGSVYYIKYLLMFYTNEVVPMKPIEADDFASILADEQNMVILLDSTNIPNNHLDSADNITPTNDHLMFAVFE